MKIQEGAPSGAKSDAVSRDGRAVLPYVIWGVAAGLSLLIISVLWPGYRQSRDAMIAERAINAGRHQDAIAPLEDIVRRLPQAWLRHLQLADCYYAAGKPDKALESYQAVQSINSSYDVNSQIGACLMDLGRDEEAAQVAARVLQLRPTDPWANFFQGRRNMETGRFLEASRNFQAASADKVWDGRAAPLRQQLADRVLKGTAPAAAPAGQS